MHWLDRWPLLITAWVLLSVLSGPVVGRFLRESDH